MKKRTAIGLAAMFTILVSVLPAMAATITPDGWYEPAWDGVFHNAHSIHVHHPLHHTRYQRSLTS